MSLDQEQLAAVTAYFEGIARHQDHTWEQVGRCVYCVDCDERLYQGRIPPEHRNVKCRSYGVHTPKETRDMRTRWGMDDR